MPTAWPPMEISTMDQNVVMGDHGRDEFPVEARDHTRVIRSVDRSHPEGYRKNNQQDHRGAESRNRAEKQADRHQCLIPEAAFVGRQGAQQVAQQPADQDGRQLQCHRPPDTGSDNIGYQAGVLVVADAERTADGIFDKIPELSENVFIQSELVLVECDLFLNLLRGRPGADILSDDGVHRITGHQPRKNEIQDDGSNQCDDKPENLLFEVFPHAFGHDALSPFD